MLKVLAVVDKEQSALDRLAQGMKPFNTNLEYNIVAVHPKRPDPEQLEEFERLAKNADIIDFYYFRTALMLLDKYPWLKDKKKILQHHNPYSLEDGDWHRFDVVVANNKTIQERLKELGYSAELIGNTIDGNFWTFNQDWIPTDKVIMVANRIEGKKGILPVAIACAELGLQLILVGSISDTEYFDAIMASGNVAFYKQITDEELRNLYYKSSIHVCNSVDNFESGTLPILEAMLTGVPVLTRKIGHVPELNNGENMIIHEGDNEDVLEIKRLLHQMINDTDKLKDLREKAWQTAKGRINERRAYEYQRLYRKLVSNDTPVSIILPIFDKPEIIRQCLDALAEQDYSNLELIVSDDSAGDHKELVNEYAKFVPFPVKYIHTGLGDYGLARARNKGVIEATGDILVFCDQRQIFEKNTISALVAHVTPKKWVYGNKGTRKEFVENVSAILRQEFIFAGMFNERCDKYGSLSQELRKRFTAQGFHFEFVEEAKATSTGKSSNRWKKKKEIMDSKTMLWKMGLGGS